MRSQSRTVDTKEKTFSPPQRLAGFSLLTGGFLLGEVSLPVIGDRVDISNSRGAITIEA